MVEMRRLVMARMESRGTARKMVVACGGRMAGKGMLLPALCVMLAMGMAAWGAGSGDCKADITLDRWVKLAAEDGGAQDGYFRDLETCLRDNTDKRSVNDTLAVFLLMNLEAMPEVAQKPMVEVIQRGLLVGAKAGNPSSQHNYASLFNARPGSRLQELVPQDYGTFMAWTRKAAGQKEWRAVFNLAMRMASEPGENERPLDAAARDPETAYILLRHLDRVTEDPDTNAAMGNVRPIVVAYLDHVGKQLGEAKSKALDGKVDGFDFRSLEKAPRA